MTLKIKVKCFQKKVGYEKEKWTMYEKDIALFWVIEGRRGLCLHGCNR